jgi:hypothetical protein
MRKVNLSEISELRRQSPKGKFGSVQTQISIALGREPDALDLAKRHPFDLTLVRPVPRPFGAVGALAHHFWPSDRAR